MFLNPECILSNTSCKDTKTCTKEATGQCQGILTSSWEDLTSALSVKTLEESMRGDLTWCENVSLPTSHRSAGEDCSVCFVLSEPLMEGAGEQALRAGELRNELDTHKGKGNCNIFVVLPAYKTEVSKWQAWTVDDPLWGELAVNFP